MAHWEKLALQAGRVPPLIQPIPDGVVAALVRPAVLASVAEVGTSATILQTTREDHCPNHCDEIPKTDLVRSRTRTAMILRSGLLPETMPNPADLQAVELVCHGPGHGRRLCRRHSGIHLARPG